jgi:hypothetical protein
VTSPTGPSNPTPPGGPGRADLFGDYDLQLRTVGCDVIDALAAAADAVVAVAPPATNDQRASLARILRGAR